MHDILEEKNREKARRAAIKEQLEQFSSSSSPPMLPINPNHQRPNSQQSLVSKTFVRDESCVNLEQQGDNECESQLPNSTQPRVNIGQGSKSNKPGPIHQFTPSPTNYLIKSRPNSSLGESNNPFLFPRNASTAPSIKRRSLPTLQPLSGRTMTLAPTSSRFFTNVTTQSGLGGRDPFVVPTNESHSPEASSFNSAPISGGRLSPEGANSESGDSLDEKGIVNHGFDDKTENIYSMVTKADPLEQNMNMFPMDAQNRNIPQMPSVTDVECPTGIGSEVGSPEKFRKLVRTESSDTEVSERYLYSLSFLLLIRSIIVFFKL